MNHSSLTLNHSMSPLMTQAVVRPRGQRHKKTMLTTIMLTSLIDAFTVIVIFVLMNPMTSNDNVQLGKNMKLPVSQYSESLEPGPVVRLEEGRYFINDKQVAQDDLRAALAQYAPKTEEDKLKQSLILQADRKDNFARFNHVILAAAQNGIQKFQFLVSPGGNK